MTATVIPSPAKWHGGKAPLASKIAALLPRSTHYVEPFAGSLAVLLARDPEGVSEVVNDIDGDLMTFWEVLRCEADFSRFARRAAATPFSERDWKAAWTMADVPPHDPVLRAWAFFVRCRFSLAGRMEHFAPISRNRTRRGMNEQVSAWLSAVDGLAEVHERIKRVFILNRDALDVIRQQDGPNTVFYIDAPYIASTRTAPDVYRHEMSDETHQRLIATLVAIQGRAAVSHYRHPIYDALHERHGWRRADFDVPNHAAGGTDKRRMVECLWMNYDPQSVAGGGGL